MNVLAFDTLIGYLGAFSCGVFALSLWSHPHRARMHVFLGYVLASLAGGFLFRSLSWELTNSTLLSAAYFCFSIFPLFLTLFIERLVGRPLPSQFKIAFLVALVFFTISCWIRPIRLHTEWKIAFMLFHVCTLDFLLLVLHRFRVAKELSKQERHVYSAIFYCTGLGLFLLILEWLYAIGPMGNERVRLSAFAALIFVRCVSSIYTDENEFTFSKELKCLLAFFGFSLTGAFVLSLASGGYSSQQFVLSTGLIYACALAFLVLYTQRVATMGAGLSEQIFKLVGLEKNTIPNLMRGLNYMAEFRSIVIVTKAQVEEYDCGEVFSSVKSGVVLTRTGIRRELLGQCPVERRDALEATQYLLTVQEADGVTAIGDTGDLLLGSPLAMRSMKHFESLLLWAAENLAFLYRRELEKTPLFPLREFQTNDEERL